ncbi:hypothetical protein FLT15_26070 [Paenibacillus thiaminolyticus]|uniref:DUF6483 family protein n=1 Tax=Paenibacillus thiaminolyticus TaxID=49283 RepID=UPI001162BAAA|nr:DUF6483 family protein [Paenibacillus thiaminolyticus]NGP61691.1 hypothetical protein [Paenibacillus thiaminolyticus]
MYRKDYLLRLVQEMTDLIGKAMNLRQQKKRTELLFEWDELLRERFRINGDLSDRLTGEDLIHLFRTNGRLHADELQAFAILLHERAKLEREKELAERHEMPVSDASRSGPDDVIIEDLYVRRSLKSLHLLLEAMLHGSDRRLLPVMETTDRLLLELKGYRLPDELLERLLAWLEREGRYAEAEDALFRWVRQASGQPPEEAERRKRQGERFYERLAECPDEALEQGGLPREELADGRADLEAIQ